MDGLFPPSDIEELHNIASKGMNYRQSTGGPTILDINTGYVRDSNGLINLFSSENDVFTSDEFGRYGRIIHRLRQLLMDTFEIADMYFTAPTFITRLDGREDWQPQGQTDTVDTIGIMIIVHHMVVVIIIHVQAFTMNIGILTRI